MTISETIPFYDPIEEEDKGQRDYDPTYTDQPLPPNGIDGPSGEPLPHAYTGRQLVRHFAASPAAQPDPEAGRRVLPPGLDWNDIAQTGWGVVYPEGRDDLLEGLRPLLELREEQAGWMFKRLPVKPGENARRFLFRHQVGPGVIDPELVPYYLLLVGGPEEVPFDLQYGLGTGYGVGRLCFDDSDGYRHYADSVVRAEREGRARSRTAALFGVETDPTTARSNRQMVGPLADRLIRDGDDWAVRTWIREDAHKARLARLLGGDETPGLLVASAHGVTYDAADARQAEQQGGLICGDWPGRGNPVERDHLFTAADLPADADLHGLFCFLFACYSAGTPEEDDFPHEDPENRTRRLAPRSFLARLPQALLGHPGGGALGIVGHVDRAWTCTYSWTQRGRQVQTLAALLSQLMRGHRAGHAMSLLGLRYAQISAQVADAWTRTRQGQSLSEPFLDWLWTAQTDARNMVLLGDPAARAGQGSAARNGHGQR